MSEPHILIVEDEKTIADTLVFALQQEHFRPTWVSGGEAALAVVTEQRFDCVILDIGLPDMNGFEVLKRLRRHSEIPVLFLTARDEEIDRILGLEMGADDYITKPFSPREVATRVKVILRRLKRPLSVSSAPTGFVHDSDQARISLCNQPLSLTKTEYLLLTTLLAQPKRVFSRTQLLSAIWQPNHPSDERSIDTHIKSLRAKIRDADPHKTYIQTHRGLGYSLG